MAKRILTSRTTASRARARRVQKTNPVLEATPFEAPVLTSDLNQDTPTGRKPLSTWKYIVGASLLVIIGLLARQGLLVAAVVNGKPIFGWQVYQTMAEKFGKQTLEELITQQLIADATRTAGVSVSGEEIESRENQMIGNIGGDVTIDELLSYQGITRKDFDNQVKMQLSVEKILANDITISDPDIDSFIASYSASLRATDEAAMREEARTALFEQKFGELVQPWFKDLKEKASIVRLFQ